MSVKWFRWPAHFGFPPFFLYFVRSWNKHNAFRLFNYFQHLNSVGRATVRFEYCWCDRQKRTSHRWELLQFDSRLVQKRSQSHSVTWGHQRTQRQAARSSRAHFDRIDAMHELHEMHVWFECWIKTTMFARLMTISCLLDGCISNSLVWQIFQKVQFGEWMRGKQKSENKIEWIFFLCIIRVVFICVVYIVPVRERET